MARTIKPSSPATDERKWKARDALSTLTRAAEIQKDVGLMRDVRRLAQETMAVVNKTGKKK